MEQKNNGKPVTTSVPSISIRFHANGEQLEELYGSDEDHSIANESSAGSTGPPSTTGGTSEPESSPLKYLPRLVKRSTSIDITPNPAPDSSPPSDPWRFFSDIRGKITKSVEEKITEIKSRNQDESGSPLKSKVKDSKDNSSVSDSEEFSESSISKTCGIVSTTEGAEMSSDDDDTPSIEKDRKTEIKAKSSPLVHHTSSTGLRQRFRLLKSKSTPTEGVISSSGLSQIYQINSDKIEQAIVDEEIESAVDALEDTNLQQTEEVLKNIENEYENIEIDKDGVVNVWEVSGGNVQARLWNMRGPRTIYAPVGYVDTREVRVPKPRNKFLPFVILFAFLGLYFLIHRYSSYLAGAIVGFTITFSYYYISSMLNSPLYTNTAVAVERPKEIVEIQAVKEFQPLTKYEGWVNELPDAYDPHTYHISQTQSVFLRLQGNLLRLSNTRSKVPKRALWNEPKIKTAFTHHRVYNLMGAQISILPEGLAKKRHWSKKYPICITLKYENQLDFGAASPMKQDEDEESGKVEGEQVKRRKFGFRKKNYKVLAQRFSKLTEENEEFELDSENSRASTPSPPSADGLLSEVTSEEQKLIDEAFTANLDNDEEDVEANAEDWGSFTASVEEASIETKLYIFGRTDREKEDWFRRFTVATHRGAHVPINDALDAKISISDILIENAVTESDYLKYMLIFNKVLRISGVQYPNSYMTHVHQTGRKSSTAKKEEKDKAENNKIDGSDSQDSIFDEYPNAELQWVNALIGRVLFDCLRDANFIQRIKDRIQRKLTSIKLPYFIEGLLITELTLGKNPPLIHRASRPVIDERGLWIDLDITYEGLIVLILQTKLNLMKLKQPHDPVRRPVTITPRRRYSAQFDLSPPGYTKFPRINPERKIEDRPAMFNSDVDDSAESTEDEEMESFESQAPQGPLDASGIPVAGLGGTSNTSKKFMKMVDRIAESKFFQAATEYRYIKKAMEGVSNTDLRLKVEVKELVGTVVVNIPPPPTDRIWVGFRPTPDLNLAAQPIVGERNITYLRITGWIEKKLRQEFQKLLVIPNMEDLTIPVMSPELPH